MTIPAAVDLPNYPFPANARTYDFEFIRMMMQGMGIVEGIAPASTGTYPMADLLVSTGGSGLNVSVAAGRAFVHGDTRSTQGMYFCYVPSATTVTLPAAHATNPRIDAIVLEVLDADVAGGSTLWRTTYQQGTATASAHIGNPTTANWLAGAPGQSGGPALQANSFVLAYVLTPALFAGPYVNATHLLDWRTHYLNKPVGYWSGAISTSSASFVQLNTNPQLYGLVVSVPQNGRLRVGLQGQWKCLAAATASIGLFLNGNQLKIPVTAGAPIAVQKDLALGAANFYSHISTIGVATAIDAASGAFVGVAGATADVSSVTTGQLAGAGATATTANGGNCMLEITGLAAGTYLVHPQVKTTASTLTLREVRMWAEVIAAG